MKKQEFIKRLKEKIDILEEKEIEDIISEYSDHIDEKIKSGVAEEKVIEDFGDIDELAKEILSAYHIKGSDKKLEGYLNAFLKKLNEIISSLLKLEGKKLISIFFRLFFLIVVIAIIKVPIMIVFDIAIGFLNFLSLGLFSWLKSILRFLLELIYFIFAMFIIYRFILKETSKSESSKG